MNDEKTFFNKISGYLNEKLSNSARTKTPAEENLDGTFESISITTNGTPLHVDETINVQDDLIVITKLEIVA